MATTENNFTGNGSQVSYPFTFEYLKTSDVKIGLKLGTGAEQVLAATEYTFPNATTLKLDTISSATTWQETSGAPKSGIKVRVHRKTADDSVASTFYPGSAIRSSDLNDNFLQNLYVTQEARNITSDSTTIAEEAKETADTADANATTALNNSRESDGSGGWTTAIAKATAASNTATNASNSVGNKIDKDGSVAMTAALTLSGAPTSDLHASTKKYVDDYLIDEDNMSTNSASRLPSQQSVKAYVDTNVDTKLSKAGGTMTGAIAMGTSKITGVGDPTSAQDAATKNYVDTNHYTKTEADTKYFSADTETIDSTETWDDADNRIATTKAIDNRVTTIVQDVGGFVPIANETSFPNTNPDVNNGAGTLVSIKALASSLTSNGSGVATIANGNLANSATVTINGLANSTTYAAGFGLIVETTTTLHTYTFHRQLAKASDVTSVASNSSNINTVAGAITNINAVAGNNTNITAVAGNESNIDIVAGELTYAEDLGLVSESLTASSGNNIDTVAGAITNINTVAGSNTNINTVAAANSNIGVVAGSISNVNTVGTNISNVNSFSDQYKVASSAPGSPSEGDLWYDSANNTLKYHNGSSFVSIASGLTNIVEDQTPELYAALDCNDKNLTEVATISGTNLQIDFGTL